LLLHDGRKRFGLGETDTLGHTPENVVATTKDIFLVLVTEVPAAVGVANGRSQTHGVPVL
jgi:hypothetical protein